MKRCHYKKISFIELRIFYSIVYLQFQFKISDRISTWLLYWLIHHFAAENIMIFLLENEPSGNAAGFISL
jgi:hypothetical protein